MTRLQQSQSSVRRQRNGQPRRPTVGAEARGIRSRAFRRAASALDLGADPLPVHVQIAGRWIAGHALNRRVDPEGRVEILVGHHGHLVWVDPDQLRLL